METRHLHRRLIIGAVLGVVALCASSTVDAADYSAALSATPTHYTGRCPGRITFKGTITANRPGKVQYRFLRSDGALAPVETLNFGRPGTRPVSTTWTLGGPGVPSYSGWQAVDILYPASVESNHANFTMECGAAPQGKPDLVIRSFGLKSWGQCEPHHAVFTFQVTVANIGTAPSPDIGQKALVQTMDQHGNGWGNGAIVGAIPPGGSKTVPVNVYYLMSDPGHMTAAAPHPFKAIADPLHLVSESNEGNNESQVINVDPRRICGQAAAGKPDLGMYGFVKIGKQQKQVRWGGTLTLTPADATLISGGKPAFEVYYGFREYNGVAVAGPFKNKLLFNGKLVSQQTNLSAAAGEIRNIHTQAYLGPQNGKLEFRVDADNEVSESREDNNAGFVVNLRFSGF